MFDPNNIFNALFIIPILNVLIGFYKLLLLVHIPGAFGFSLILLTVLIRIVLYPATVSQLKNTQKLSKLKPHIDRLSEKYKNDKQQFHKEQLKLYQQEGINPATGCLLPLLFQLPILFVYNLIFQLLSTGNIQKIVEEMNKVMYAPFLKVTTLEYSFFGANLLYKPSEWQKIGWWLLLVPVITGLLQYWQMKLMTPMQAAQKVEKVDEAKDKDKKEDDMSTAMQKQMSFMFPLMIGYFAYAFPLGLSLYWNTSTVFGIIQQYRFNKSTRNENGEGKIKNHNS